MDRLYECQDCGHEQYQAEMCEECGGLPEIVRDLEGHAAHALLDGLGGTGAACDSCQPFLAWVKEKERCVEAEERSK